MRKLILALLILAAPVGAAAQNYLRPNLPPKTILGNPYSINAPAQAIPFSALANDITAANLLNPTLPSTVDLNNLPPQTVVGNSTASSSGLGLITFSQLSVFSNRANQAGLPNTVYNTYDPTSVPAQTMIGNASASAPALALPISLGTFFLATYLGPCDLVTCAEAFSMTRAMTVNYTGPLFQLYNGSTTKDIGQTNHVVDLTTWSSFCSGVPSNCVVSKIYGQINSNNLVPSNISPGGSAPVCTASLYICASPFVIEGNTGLPIMVTQRGKEYYQGSAPGADDTASTGINAGTAALSIVYNSLWIAQNYCCGMMGMTHKYNDPSCPPCTMGTDFMAGLGYGTTGSIFFNCSTSSTFCGGAEEESINDVADFAASNGLNAVLGIAFNPSGSGTVNGYVNGTSLFSHSPPAASLNVGKFIHLGGGGDLTQYASTFMREVIIANSAISSTNQSVLASNMTAFYGTATSSFFGVGDVVPGASAYYGLRAYKVSTVGTPAVNIRRSSNGHTCDVAAINGAGAVNGNTLNCSTSGDNGQTSLSFCGGNGNCTVTEFYDQTGNGNNLTQATVAKQPALTFGCGIGATPFGGDTCVTFDGSQTWLVGAGCSVSAFPITVGFLAKRTGNTSAVNGAYTPCQTTAGVGDGPFYTASSNTGNCQFGGSGTTHEVDDSAWNSVNCAAPASGAQTNNFVVNITNTAISDTNTFKSGNPSSMGANDNGGSASNLFNGNMMEAYAYPFALSVSQQQLICGSQTSYFNPVGTPPC